MTLQELEQTLINISALDIAEDAIEKLPDLVNYVLSVYGKYKPLNLRDTFSLNLTTVLKKDRKGRLIRGIKGLYLFNPELNDYRQFSKDWKYDINSGNLYVKIPGIFLIDYLAQPILDDISFRDDMFLNLMIGYYKMYIGSHRKQFSMSSLPFENDAESMYAEGNELWEQTIEKLENETGSWYLAIE